MKIKTAVLSIAFLTSGFVYSSEFKNNEKRYPALDFIFESIGLDRKPASESSFEELPIENASPVTTASAGCNLSASPVGDDDDQVYNISPFSSAASTPRPLLVATRIISDSKPASESSFEELPIENASPVTTASEGCNLSASPVGDDDDQVYNISPFSSAAPTPRPLLVAKRIISEINLQGDLHLTMSVMFLL